MASDNPLLKALPPETDHITYLTILEYNLTKEQLPTLNDILQDTTLTAAIGWDLVHLLIPLLPESEQCLRSVAYLGNPREVILKVTEVLEGIARESEDAEDEDDEEQAVQAEYQDENQLLEKPSNGQHPALRKDKGTASPSRETRFKVLLSLLSILHPRIKTKYPSRFLSTSLQAILSTYTSLSQSHVATESILSFLKEVSGTKRPQLPPRRSSVSTSTLQKAQAQNSAPDPEANKDGIGAGETELQRRLLQSFLTYVVEVYFSGLQEGEDVPGMSYAARYQEELTPKKNIPGRQTRRELFEEEYHPRDAVMGQLLALARDLELDPSDLLSTLLKPPDTPTEKTEAELPSSASDVPLSSTGSLHILSAWLASKSLFETSNSPSIELPDYTVLVNAVLHPPSSPTFATETPAYLDALFYLGLYTLHVEPSISPSSDQDFNDALQRLSLLSAQLPSPSQRFQGHQLASTLLQLHPSDQVKLAYIKDTLEHCPYENLKGSAVGWLKDQVLTANAPAHQSGDERGGIFASPALLEIVGEWLWGDGVGVALYPSAESKERRMEAFFSLQNMLPFYLGVLNLLYLLVHNDRMFQNLAVDEAIGSIQNHLLRPLMDAATGFTQSFVSGDLGEGEDQQAIDAQVANMQLLMMNCQQILDKITEKEKG